jgi:flagellar biosynthesis/type III secretory pathway protein FliH
MSKVIKGGGSNYPDTSTPPFHNPTMSPRVPIPPPARSGGGVVSRDLVDARSEAQRIIQDAVSEATRIREQAEAYRQQGYNDGYAEGLDLGKAEMTEVMLRINRENEAKFRFFEHDLVKLALRISEKIIGEQLRVEPSSVNQIVAKALGAVRHQREIYLRVNPEDFELIREHKYLLLEQLSRAQDIDIRPDGEVEKGGCLIESETGTIEATLEKQLKAIEKILLGDT